MSDVKRYRYLEWDSALCARVLREFVLASAFEDRMGDLQVENGKLSAEVEALRLLAGELYQVLGALDAPAGVLDAVLAAAHGESMEGRGSLLPFVSEEHEALRKDAERYRWLRDQASLEPFDGWAYDLPAVDAWDCKPGPQLNEQFGSFDEAIDAAKIGRSKE